jgi:fructose-1,6-bisphosphatase/inositol monophosphatase family enzyme
MRLTIADALRVGEILARAARTELMPRFGRLSAGQVRAKSSRFDVVTDADEAAERAMATALTAAHPDAVVVGEEAAARDPTLLGAVGTADLAFVLDPLDGTKNFAAGVPLFGVMAAATMRGEVVLAALHDSVCRTTALALRGEGARTQGEEESINDPGEQLILQLSSTRYFVVLQAWTLFSPPTSWCSLWPGLKGHV